MTDGDKVRITSRRGSVEAPARIDPGLRTRPRVHDHALPRRSRHQPAHHRRHRPPVGHGRVQGRACGREWSPFELRSPFPRGHPQPGRADRARPAPERRRPRTGGPSPAAARPPRRPRRHRLDQPGWRSTRSAAGSMWRRPRPTGWPRSTACSRWSPARPGSSTCVSTWPAGWRVPRSWPKGCSGDPTVAVEDSPCLGLCERAPAALAVTTTGRSASEAVLAPATRETLSAALEGGAGAATRGTGGGGGRPPAGRPALVLLRRVGRGRSAEPRRLPRPRRLRGAAARPSSWGPPGSSGR